MFKIKGFDYSISSPTAQQPNSINTDKYFYAKTFEQFLYIVYLFILIKDRIQEIKPQDLTITNYIITKNKNN